MGPASGSSSSTSPSSSSSSAGAPNALAGLVAPKELVAPAVAKLERGFEPARPPKPPPKPPPPKPVPLLREPKPDGVPPKPELPETEAKGDGVAPDEAKPLECAAGLAFSDVDFPVSTAASVPKLPKGEASPVFARAPKGEAVTFEPSEPKPEVEVFARAANPDAAKALAEVSGKVSVSLAGDLDRAKAPNPDCVDVLEKPPDSGIC